MCCIKKSRSIFIVGALVVFLLCVGSYLLASENPVYAAESGRCDVYDGDTKIAEAIDIREGWELAKKNSGSTIVLTSDVKLDEELETNVIKRWNEISFNMNGYSIDCQNKCRAFHIHLFAYIKIYNSKYGTRESVIENANNSAILDYGALFVEGITIQNCEGANGGAVNLIAARDDLTSFNDPHADIKDCTIKNCEATAQGGAISTSIVKMDSAEAVDQYSNVNNIGDGFGAILSISNTTISSCKATSGIDGNGGGISFSGKCTIQDSVIEHCRAQAGGGGIRLQPGAELIMRNSKVNYNKANDGRAGGIYIPDSIGGEDPQKPGSATITDGEIIGNEGDYAGGIYMMDGHGGAQLTIGGELVVKDNIDTSNKQRNIELEDHTFDLTKGGLTGNASVGIGTQKRGEEVLIGNGCDVDTAGQSALLMFPDHKRGVEANDDDELGIYNYSGTNEIYMGPSRKIELISFKLTGEDRANVKVDIDNTKKTITAKFPFKEGTWFENWEAEWYAGKQGSENEGEIFTSTGHEGSKDHPFCSGTTTYSDAEKVDNDYVSIKRNNALKHWDIIFINDPNSMGKVIVENGIVQDKKAESSSTEHEKIYSLSGGDKVKLKADDPADGKVFDYWEKGSDTTGGSVSSLNDPNADCWVPGNNGVMHLIARYTEKKKVTVINGTLENGLTEGYFSPGEEVKIKADNTKDFAKWTVVSGNAEMETGATAKAETSFKMGTNTSQSQNNYTDVVIKATDLSIEEPTTSLKPGKYTGNQKTYLNCKTENAKIFYSVDSSSYKQYDGEAINLTVGEYQQSRRYKIKAYSVLYDSSGEELIRSETAAFEFDIYNSKKIERRTLIVYGGGIIEKGGMSKVKLNPGEKVTALAADESEEFKNFDYWEVLSGPLELSVIQKLTPQITFVMPNADVVLMAHFKEEPSTQHTATAKGGTVNGRTQVKAKYGDEIKASAKASKTEGDTKYQFEKWDVYIKSKSEPLYSSNECVFTFTMPDEDVMAVASYREATDYNVSVVKGYLGDDKTKTTGTYRQGDTVKVSCVQSNQNGSIFTFDYWTVDSGSLTLTEEQSKTATNMEFVMPKSDVVLRAVFKETKLPESVQVINGTITGKTSSFEKYLPGAKVSISANADIEGERKFSRWESTGILSYTAEGRDWTFFMPDNSVIATAIFADNNLVTINGGNRKAYTEDKFIERNLYELNGIANIKAFVPEGSEFGKWEVVSAPSGFKLSEKQKTSEKASIKMTPKGDVVLKALFKHSYSATNATVEVDDSEEFKESGTAIEGSKLTVKYTGQEGKALDHWEAVGVELPEEAERGDTEFTVYMPDNDVSFMAIEKDPKIHTLKVNQGYINNDKSKSIGSYVEGSKVKVSGKNPGETGNSSYVFAHWEADGITLTEEQKTSENITITMPDGNVTLTANYSPRVSGNAVHGKIDGKATQTDLEPGKKATATADAGVGLAFDHWEAIGVELTAEQKKTEKNMSFEIPSNDFVLIAKYTSTPITVNTLVTQNGVNKKSDSTEEAESTGTYAPKDEVTITAVNPGTTEGEKDLYSFLEWRIVSAPEGFSIASPTAENTTVTMPDGDVVLKAVFEKKHNYSATNATISYEGTTATSGKAFEGSELEVKLIDGKELDHWEAVGVELPEEAERGDTEFTVEMPDNDVSIMAVLNEPTTVYTLKVNQGYIDDDKAKSIGSYGEGSNVKVSGKNPGETGNSSYVFAHWEADGITLTDEQKATENITITMPKKDVTLTAVYSLRVSGSAVHGKIDGKATQTDLEPGKNATATADAGVGLAFDHWEATGVTLTADQKKTEKNMSFEIPSNDFVLIAKYTSTPITVNTLVTQNGVNKKSGSTEEAETTGTYAPNDEVTITAVNPGTTTGEEDLYRFVKWKIVSAPDGFSIKSPKDAETTVTMPDGDVVLKAVFEKKHNYSATNATISYEGTTATSGKAFEGSELEVKLIDGKELDHWEAVGVELPEEAKAKATEFTVKMPDKDVSIMAVLKDPTTVHTLKVNQGYIDDDKTKSIGSYGEGSKVKVSGKNPGETENSSYVFAGWTATGITLSDVQKKSENIEITMPGNDVTLEAEYSLRVEGNAIHGKINDKATQTNLEPGESATATANIASEMTFKEWEAIGVTLDEQQKTTANMSFKVPSNDFVLIARYESTPVTVNTLYTENGVNIESGSTEEAAPSGTYAANTKVTIQAINPGADSGEEDFYEFVAWEVVDGPDGYTLSDPEEKNQEITMPDTDLVLNALYLKKHSTVAIHGTINDKKIGTSVEGETIEAKADTGAGLTFDHWDANGILLTDEQKYNEEFSASMPDNDIVLQAQYNSVPEDVYTLDVTRGVIVDEYDESGKPLRSNDYHEGSAVVVKADEGAGLTFDHWEAVNYHLTDEEMLWPVLEITMPKTNVTLEAHYRLIQYTATAENGTLNGESQAKFSMGTSVEAVAKAPKGTKFHHWEAQGITLTKDQKKSKKFTFTMPANNVTLKAVCKGSGNGASTGEHKNLLLCLGILTLALLAAVATLLSKTKEREDI